MVMEAVKSLSAEEITELCLRHTLYDWSVQAGLKPLPVSSAKGVHFHTADGRRFLDFNSQLMSVNAGHGDRRIIEAIKRQAEQLPYISPFMAHEARARLGAKLAELLPGDMEKVFFTLGGTEANENAIKMARAVTGRPKVLARYRSYHGSTGTAIQATGDPRRWPNENASGVVHVLDPYHGIQRGWDTVEEALAPFNGTSPEMKAVATALVDGGMHTFVRWYTVMTNPPLCITEAELEEGFEILDSALEIGDRAVRD